MKILEKRVVLEEKLWAWPARFVRFYFTSFSLPDIILYFILFSRFSADLILLEIDCFFFSILILKWEVKMIDVL